MKLSLKDIKRGDILICINNDDLHGQLTILKEYKVISKYNIIGNYYCIVTICDDKTKGIYPLHNFITNIQFRKLKINKLYENIKEDIVRANNKFMNMSKDERQNLRKSHNYVDIFNIIQNMKGKSNIEKNYNKLKSKFKKGDIVVCTSIEGIIGDIDIEVGKKYKISNISTINNTYGNSNISYVYLENSNSIYLDKYFQSLEENRIEKINRLKEKTKSKSNIFKKIFKKWKMI